MATNMQSSRSMMSLSKRFLSQIHSRDHAFTSSLSLRSVHDSVYEKNLEEHVQPNVIPDDLIPPQSDKYWAPNPRTGVFGPASVNNPAAGVEHGVSIGNSSEESVLEQKTFFRPLEDLEKPTPP